MKLNPGQIFVFNQNFYVILATIYKRTPHTRYYYTVCLLNKTRIYNNQTLDAVETKLCKVL